MFEALFILTTIDAGTRIARFIVQEAGGKFYKPLGQTNWIPGNIFASILIVFCWAYFIYTGTVATIWPMFGTANQLLATLALAIGTSYIINNGKAKYAWITIIPMLFVGITTVTAGILNLKNLFLPQIFIKATFIQGLINSGLTLIILICVVSVIADAVPKWFKSVRFLNLK